MRRFFLLFLLIGLPCTAICQIHWEPCSIASDATLTLATADADQDGDNDVAVLTTGHHFYVLENEWPDWIRHDLGISSGFETKIAAEDMDLDGDIDFVVCGNSGVAVYTNHGGLSFTRSTIYFDHSIRDMHVIDFDDDGDVDILAAVWNPDPWNPGMLLLITHDGNDYTETVIDDNVEYASSIFGFDNDGDWDIDLLVATGSALFLYENNGDVSFTRSIIDGTPIRIAVAYDMDNDGDPDIIGMERDLASELGIYYQWIQNSDGWTRTTLWWIELWSVEFLTEITIVDLDNDIDLDIVTPEPGAEPYPYDFGGIKVGFNDGSGNYSLQEFGVDFDFSPRCSDTNDMDSDGDVDIIVNGGGVRVYRQMRQDEPYELTVSLDDNGWVTLAWNSVETEDFLWYNIYRDQIQVGTSTGPSFEEQLPVYGQYHYTVSAQYDGYESPQTQPVSVWWIDQDWIEFVEDFDDGLSDSWTVEGHTQATLTWHIEDPPWQGRFDSPHAFVQSPGEDYLFLYEALISPIIDISGYQMLYLLYEHDFKADNEWWSGYEVAGIVYWSDNGGTSWHNLIGYSGDWNNSVHEHVILNLSDLPFQEYDFRLKFYYEDWGLDGWWGLDDIKVVVDRNTLPVDLCMYSVQDTLPAEGGTVVYNARFKSELAASGDRMRFFTRIRLPDGQDFGPLFDQCFYLLPFMDVTVTGLAQAVPASAPAGTYVFQGHVQNLNNTSQLVRDHVTFVKEGSLSPDVFSFNPDEWQSGGVLAISDNTNSANHPSSLEPTISRAYPNPFNTLTTIEISLPEPSALTVVAFDILGREVDVLANSYFASGIHRLSFDASNLASGLYFIRAKVPGQLNATQKVMLVR